MMRNLFVFILSILPCLAPCLAQDKAVIIADSTEARFIDRYNISYTHKQYIKILEDGAIGDARKDSILILTSHHDSNNYKYIEPWQPQGSYPISQAVYKLITPIGYELSLMQQGDNGLRILPVDTITSNTRFLGCRHQYEVRNLPAVYKDDYIICPEDYVFRISHIIEQITNVDGTIEYGTPTWEEIDQDVYNTPLIGQMKDLNNPYGQQFIQQQALGKKVLPVVLRKRSSGLLSRTIPSVDIYDEMVLAVIGDKDTLYIDPRQPDSIMHILPIDLMSNYARILDYDGQKVTGTWVNLFTSGDYRKINYTNYSMNAEGHVYGKMVNYYRNHALLEKGFEKDSCTVDYELPIKNDTLYFTPFDSIEKFDIPDSTRTQPLDYPYRVNIRHNISLSVDDSYSIVNYPKSESFISSLGSLGAQVKSIVIDEHKISIVFVLQRNVMSQLPSAHDYTIEFYKQLLKKFTETITIVKKES